MAKPGSGISAVEWHFFESPVTGIGPTESLINALEEAGIHIIVHLFCDRRLAAFQRACIMPAWLLRRLFEMDSNSLNYPLLLAPIPVMETKAADWSATDAQIFFCWFVEHHRSRVDKLLTFLGKELPESSQDWEEFLGELGGLYAEHLRRKEFSEVREHRYALTHAGTSLVFDANLLVAFLLISYPGSHLWWKLLIDPGAFSHNHPVLRGFEYEQYLDPFAGIHEARALLGDRKSPDLLRNIFVFWKNQII